MQYRFDGEEMLATAKALFVINPHISAAFATPEEVVEDMRNKVRANLFKASYLSIYGYVLTTFDWPGNEGETLGVKASLSTYTVAKHYNIAGAC